MADKASNLVSGKAVWDAITKMHLESDGSAPTIMVCNTRYPEAIPGIMQAAERLEAAIGFELSTREMFHTGVVGKDGQPLYSKNQWVDERYDGGLGRFGPKGFVEAVEREAGILNKGLAFVHGDHIQIKPRYDEKQIQNIELFIKLLLESGCRSFGIDPSFFPVEENVEYLARLAPPILKAGGAIEGEVGEIDKDRVTTVQDTLDYMKLVKDKLGDVLSLLAINYGTKHGEGVFVPHLKRAYEVATETGVAIAGHGTSGTKDACLEMFPFMKIAKANVGTNWDTVGVYQVPGMEAEYKGWAAKRTRELGLTGADDKPISKEYAHFALAGERAHLPPKDLSDLTDRVRGSALHLMRLFQMEGTAQMIREQMKKKQYN